MFSFIEAVLQRYLARWHGRGEAHQYDYYRCHGCGRLVTWNAIRQGGCTCGLSHKLSPAHVRWYEQLRLLVCPWWCVR